MIGRHRADMRGKIRRRGIGFRKKKTGRKNFFSIFCNKNAISDTKGLFVILSEMVLWLRLESHFWFLLDFRNGFVWLNRLKINRIAVSIKFYR